jgi:translocation and assembly module TamB
MLGLAAIVVIGVAALLHSQRFHDYVLIKARQSATESLGVPVELQNYALHFKGISPTVDLYGFVIHGASPYADTPLVQVEQARIGVRVISLLRRRWYFSELAVHHGVLQIRVDANGNNNLPTLQQGGSRNSGVQSFFDLAIRRVVLDEGEFDYNDRRIALDADLREVALNAAYDPSRKLYAGQVAYSDGRFKGNGYEPIAHALTADFEMTSLHINIRKAELHSGASAVAFTGTFDDFDNPRVATVFHASVDASALRRLLNIPQLPMGMAELDGHAEYAFRPNQPALNAITVNGTLRSDRLELLVPSVQTRTVRAELGAVRAVYALVNGDAEVRSLSASLLSGRVDAQATVRDLAGEQVGAAQVKLYGISLGALKDLFGTSAEDDLTIGGTVQAAGSASWKRSLRNLQVKADASVNAAVGSKQSSEGFPVTGELHGSFQNSDQTLTLTQSYFRTSQSILTLDGSMGQRSQINLALNAGDLHEMETIARIFLSPARPLGLYGSATFTGVLAGPTSEPRLTGELSSTNLRLRATDWRLLRAHLDMSPSGLEIKGGQLEPASPKGAVQGNIALSGRAELKHWNFTTASRFQLTLNARRLDAAQLERLAGAPTRVSGTVNAELQAHGTEMNPIGQGEIELVHASVDGEPIQSAHVQFNGDGNAAHANLNITMPAGVTTGSLTYYPRQRGYEARLETHNFNLNQLQVLKSRNLSIAGVMNLVANGRGTLDDPQLTASIDIPQLQAKGQTIDHIALQANVAHHVANISLDTRAVNANIHGRATVQLTGDYLADAVLDTQPIPLQPLVVTYAPDMASHLSGQTELHATLKGPLKHRERIEAHVVIPTLDMHYDQSIDLAAAGPIHADYANGVLELARSGLKGTGTDLQFQGSIPLLDRSKPVSLLLLGSVDLRIAQLFDPDVTSSGQLQFNINTYGVRSDPNVRGDVRIVNASFSMIDLPVGLSNGNGTLALTGDRLNITNFEGTVGGGKITARGGVVYHPSLQFDLALSGQGIRMLYPDAVRQELSGNLTLTGTPEQATLRGQVNVDQLSFTPDFDLSSITSFESGGAEEPPSRGFLSNLQLNVAVRSTQNVNAASRTISVNGSANLRLTGTAAQPVVLGRINLTGGDLIFQGNRYILQSGVIDFVNPSRTEPNINASITTTILQYNIGLRFEGRLDRLRTSYSSTPALPPADIINLIAFGKTQEAANATATTANQTAEQSIASAVSGQVTSRVQNFVGLSQLSVDPTLGAGQQNAGAIITVQKRVTSKIFVTFQTDVTSTQQDVVQLEYQATPQVSLSGTRDQNGGFGFDTRITREW